MLAKEGSQAFPACVSPADTSWDGWMTSHPRREFQGDVGYSPVGNECSDSKWSWSAVLRV